MNLLNDTFSLDKYCESLNISSKLEYYKNWAEDYDIDTIIVNWRIPEIIYNTVSKNSDLDNLRLLDIGCGTGCLGNKFKNEKIVIDGIDLTKEMLLKAKYKGYNKLYEGNINDVDFSINKRYDGLISSGVFGDNEEVNLVSAFKFLDRNLSKHSFFASSFCLSNKIDYNINLNILKKLNFEIIENFNTVGYYDKGMVPINYKIIYAIR